MPDLILARFHRLADEAAIEAKVARVCRTAPDLLERLDPASPAGRRALRGIPCVANGVTGTIPGTDPLGAILDSERH